MRKFGRCPVYTERAEEGAIERRQVWDGKPAPHIMLRAERGARQVWGTADHPITGNFARCSGCGLEDRDYHFCDAEIHYYIGNWPHTKSCDRRATNHRDTRKSIEGIGPDNKGDFWFCDAHTEEAVETKLVLKRAREDARWEAGRLKDKYGYTGKGLENILVDLLKWAKHNDDLVDSDEWLGQIVRAAKKIVAVERLEEVDDGK